MRRWNKGRWGALAGAVMGVLALVSGTAAAQEVRWSFEAGAPLFAAPALEGDLLFLGASDGSIFAVERENGLERWRFQAGGAVDATPAVSGGMVFAPSRDGVFYALDALDGSLLWSFRTQGETRHDFWDFYLSDPLVVGDLVVFGSGDGHVYALDRRSGALRWQVGTDAPVHGAPVAGEGTLYVGGFDGGLRAMDSASGQLLWTFQAEGNEHFPDGALQRAPLLVDGVLYVGSRDYRLYAVDASTGEELWRIRDGAGWIIATPLALGETLFFGASDGQRFYAVDRKTGEVKWSIPVRTRVFGSAVEAGGSILFGGFNGILHAVDPASGATRWSFQTPESLRSFHRVYTEAGELNDEMRDLYRTGRWMEAEERLLELGSIPGAPVVEDGSVFFGSTEGLLYALELPAP